MSTSMSPFRVLPGLLLVLGAASCGAPASRVAPGATRRVAEWPAPPARPQVMVDAPLAAAPAQAMVATMSEAERTEILRAVGSPIRPYTPAPLPAHTVIVERRVVEPMHYDHHYHTSYCGPGCRVGEAIALGATVAFFTAPFWWGFRPWCD